MPTITPNEPTDPINPTLPNSRVFPCKVMKTRSYTEYHGRAYSPVAPIIADHDDIALKCDRLLFCHGSATKPELRVFTAKRGVITAGWVIGLFDRD